jgi:hypothetical protein
VNQSLAGLSASLEIPPAQLTSFRNAQPGYIKGGEQNLVPSIRLVSSQRPHVLLGHDALRQGIVGTGQIQRARGIPAISEALRNLEQAPDGGERAALGDRRQTGSGQRFGESLQIESTGFRKLQARRAKQAADVPQIHASGQRAPLSLAHSSITLASVSPAETGGAMVSITVLM